MKTTRLRFVLFAIPLAAVAAVTVAAARNHPANGAVIDPTCTSSSPCIEYDNNGTGPGIRGISVNGNGLAGATKNISTSPANGREGLIGNDISSSGFFNAGVRGLSTRGAGVAGQSTSGPGVSGSSSTSAGVQGSSTSDRGLSGFSTNFIGVEGAVTGSGVAGVQGTNTSSSIAIRANGLGGPLFVGNNSSAVDVFTVDDSGNTLIKGALSATSVSSGDAIDATTSAGSGAAGILAINTGTPGDGGDIRGTYIGVVGRAPAGTGQFPLVATDGVGNNLFYVDGAGNVFAHGAYGTFAITRTGKTSISYNARAASPTIEDTGSGQLVNGVGMVELDPAFAQTIDPRVQYHVMLTPDGDTRGLFVASKGPSGFVVREVQGGRGSLAFDYHIYATALGHANERMAVLTRDAAASLMPKAPLSVHRVTRPALRYVPKSAMPRIWGH